MKTSLYLLIESIEENVNPNLITSDFEEKLLKVTKSLKETPDHYFYVDEENLTPLNFSTDEINSILDFIEKNQDNLEPDDFNNLISFR